MANSNIISDEYREYAVVDSSVDTGFFTGEVNIRDLKEDKSIERIFFSIREEADPGSVDDSVITVSLQFQLVGDARWQNGWFTLDYKSDYAVYANVYNCTGYHNGHRGEGIGGTRGYFASVNTSLDTDQNELLRVFKNCVSYDNENGDLYIPGSTYYTHEYNTWDIPITVADADFLSVDSAGITGARGTGGTLPVLTFLHLDDDQLNGVGIGVGLVYDGDSLYHNDPPDLGAFAYDAGTPTPPELPVVTTTLTSSYSRGALITGVCSGTSITARGVCYSTSANPTTSDDYVPSGSGEGTFTSVLPLAANTTYHMRAYATNATGTSYGADVEKKTPVRSAVLSDGIMVLDDNGYAMIIE